MKVTDLNDRASHPCAVVHRADTFDVVVKLTKIPEGVAEVKGLNLIRHLAFLGRIARALDLYR